MRLLASTKEWLIRNIDLATGTLRTLEGHPGYVHGLAVTPDGKRAESASADKTLKVWDLDTGVALLTLEGHSGYVYGVAVTPDGRRAVSASDDNTLKVWDLERGARLATFTCDSASYSCAFINDHKLVAGDAGGRVYFLKFEHSKRER